MRSATRRREAGVAGSEVLILSALIFVGGTLMLINLWAIIDARMIAGSSLATVLEQFPMRFAPPTTPDLWRAWP